MTNYKKYLSACLVWALPIVCFAQETTNAAYNAGSAAGRVIGMCLFGYIVMKIANRNKEVDEKKSNWLLYMGGAAAIGVLLSFVSPKQSDSEFVASYKAKSYSQCESQASKAGATNIDSTKLHAYCVCAVDAALIDLSAKQLRNGDIERDSVKVNQIAEQCAKAHIDS
jgi:hypothetical protein